MPAVALSRVAARVVESGPDGENLAPGAWQRLEALPDPRSPQGRIYPLACLIAVAVCAFTAAGNDRFTAVGQWIKRASQADLARLRAPWDPIAGRYRAPDEKTIRVVLDRLDPRALTRALLGPRPRRRGARRAALGQRARLPCPARRPAGESAGPRPVTGSGRGRQDLPRRPARRRHQSPSSRRRRTRRAPPGSPRGRRQAQRDQPLHRAPGTPGPGRCRGDLRRPAYGAGEPELAGREKKAHYIAVVKKNQPLLHARVKALPWRQVPAGSVTRDTGHGRIETRTLKAAHVSRLDFPHARQAIKITRWRQGHRHRQDHPRDRLRRHQPDQRARHRAGPGPPGPRALVHRGTPPHKGHDVQRRHRHQPYRQRARQPGHHPRRHHRGHQRRRLPARPRRPTRPHHPRRNPPPPRPRLGQKWDIHGTRRSPAASPGRGPRPVRIRRHRAAQTSRPPPGRARR